MRSGMTDDAGAVGGLQPAKIASTRPVRFGQVCPSRNECGSYSISVQAAVYGIVSAAGRRTGGGAG